MFVTVRLILILTLLIVMTPGLFAQQTSTTTTAPATATAATAAEPETAEAPEGEAVEERSSSFEVRERLTSLIARSPDQLATVLAHEPTLLQNEQFLSGHPELARFVAAHPEVRQSPSFYLADFTWRTNRREPLEHFVEAIGIFSIFLLITLALAWFVRTVIEQKRWNRLSKTQSDVHNKILDRFGTSEELLSYVKSPAGTKFLESAPIPLHEERPTSAPLGRAIWSIQIGVVVAAGALGMLLVSGRFDKESAQGLFAMGAIGFCIGAGFIVSALISLIISKRFGLWKDPAGNGVDETSLVR